MTCLHCGKELNGDEMICPDCGNVVEKNSSNNSYEIPVIISSEEVVANTNNKKKTTKFKKKGLFVIILIIIVIIVGVLVFSCLFKKTNLSKNDNEVLAREISSDGNRVSFLGYSFDVPEGFNTSEEAEKLFLESNSIVYFISFDYTNSFDDYYKELSKLFPKQASNIKRELYGREYLVLKIFDARSGVEHCQFVTKGNGNDVIVGKMVNDKSRFIEEDFNILTRIIDSSKSDLVGSKNSNADVGKYGIKIYDSIG